MSPGQPDLAEGLVATVGKSLTRETEKAKSHQVDLQTQQFAARESCLISGIGGTMTLKGTEPSVSPDKNLTTEQPSYGDDVLALVYAAIAETNLQLPKQQRIDPSRDTTLFGDGGSVDSLVLANLIVVTEQKLEERFGFRIDLTADDPFSPLTGHFRTVGSLVAYISSFVAR